MNTISTKLNNRRKVSIMATIAELLGNQAAQVIEASIKVDAGGNAHAEPRRSKGDRLLDVSDGCGRYCGVLSARMLTVNDLSFTLQGNAAKLNNALTDETRLRLLRTSLSMLDVDHESVGQVQDEIASILSSRIALCRAVDESSDDLYVVRDSRGLLLGLMSESYAEARWYSLKKCGPMLLVDQPVSQRGLPEPNDEMLAKESGYSDRTMRSIGKVLESAADRNKVRKLLNRDDYSPAVVRVLYREDEAIAIATLDMVSKHFNDSWFFVDDACVQLVLDLAPELVAEKAVLAAKESSRKYEIGSPGTLARKRKKQPSVKKKSVRNKQKKDASELKRKTVTLPKEIPPRLKRVLSSGSRKTSSDSAWYLTGGIAACNIRAYKDYSPWPEEHQLTEQERKEKWIPPQRDTSRFSGSSATRHNAQTRVVDPPDYDSGYYE